MSEVPIVRPAEAQKNPDGTYTVRIQHTVEGSVSEVSFPNHAWAETMATIYAEFVNGKQRVVTLKNQITDDADNALSAIKRKAEQESDAIKAEAEILHAKAKKLVADAEEEATKLKQEAQTFTEKIKDDAAKLLSDAKAEAQSLVDAVKKAKPPKPVPAKKSDDLDDEI